MEKDHLEILLEDIRSKFDLVLEGHDVLRKEIKEARDESNSKHEHTVFLIDTLNKKIDSGDASLNGKIDGVEARLNDKIDTVEARLSDKIDSVDARLSDKIDTVEARLSVKIDAVAADLSAHRKDTEAHHGVYRVKEN